MKNALILDIDTSRTTNQLRVGKPSNFAFETDGLPMLNADLDLVIKALVIHMRMVEQAGANVTELIKLVFKDIESGMFSPHIQINPKADAGKS